MPATHETPQLTVYRNGLVNLNGEATRLLSTDSLRLLDPTRSEPHWLLLAHPQLVGDIKLRGRADRRRHLRFRHPDFAIALFAGVPTGQEQVRMLVEPVAEVCWRLVAQKLGT
jgi:hypothetical protein